MMMMMIIIFIYEIDDHTDLARFAFIYFYITKKNLTTTIKEEIQNNKNKKRFLNIKKYNIELNCQYF